MSAYDDWKLANPEDDFQGTEHVKIEVGPFLLKCEVSSSGVHILKAWWLRSDDLTYECSEKPKAASHLENFLWLQFGDEIDKKATAKAHYKRSNIE